MIAFQSILYTHSYITKTNDSAIVYGQIPLNHVLTSSSPYLSNLRPQSLAPSDVIPLLTKQLSWKLQTLNSTTKQLESIDVNNHGQLRRTLRIFVIGREVISAGAGDQLPVYGDVKIWRAATKGKAGGLGEEEGL